MRIGLHQIYYEPKQLPLLEPSFIPYDNTANTNREWAEYHVFETEYRKGTHKKFDYTGFVSWKFGQKTSIAGARFIDFAMQNPGADMYFINPFPMEELLFSNVWEQGEFYHKGILDFSQRLLERAGYSFDLRGWNQPYSTFAFCNYWIANKKFWDEYMHFTQAIAEILRSHLNNEERAFLHSIASKTNNFSYIAFIMERMFGVFLVLHPELAWRRYPYSRQEMKTRFPGIRAKIADVLATKSPLLAPARFVAATLVKATRKNKEP